MGITLSQIASNTAQVTLTGGTLSAGQSATIVYYPGRITENAVIAPTELGSMTTQTAPDKFKAFNEMLAHLIQSWDVLQDDGSMFPIDPALFVELPFAFRMQVYTTIMRDIRPEALVPQTTLN
jgi:hypothetical protein